MQIKKLQAAMLAVLGPTSAELLDAAAHHGINAENCQSVLRDVVAEIKSFLNTLHIPTEVPEQENKGLFGLQRVIYVDGQVILSEAQEFQVSECFATELTDNAPVPPTALCTLFFNTDTLLDKTVKMLTDGAGDSPEHHHDHMVKHIARLVSYLNLLKIYSTHCIGRDYDHHAAVVVAVEETRSELLTEMESAEEEQLMLYEGVECLLAGRNPETRGELYTEGVLTANSMYNVFGGEAWYDSIMSAVNKVIEKLKQGWEWFINLFKGDKAPEETIKKAEEAADKAFPALLEKVEKSEDATPNEELINKLLTAFESYEIGDSELKQQCAAIIAKFKELLSKKGKALVEGLKSLCTQAKDFYKKYANKASLLQKGKAQLDKVTSLLSKLKGKKEEDKEGIKQERTALEGELQTAKELEKEARETVKQCERIGSPLIQLMYNPTNFVML